jgi:hypothetical protein
MTDPFYYIMFYAMLVSCPASGFKGGVWQITLNFQRSPKSSKSSVHPFFLFLFILVCEAIGTAATPGLLCQPRVIVKMIVDKQMECRLAGKTEVLGENLPQRHFYPSQNPT